jgi:hypothetical protein
MALIKNENRYKLSKSGHIVLYITGGKREGKVYLNKEDLSLVSQYRWRIRDNELPYIVTTIYRNGKPTTTSMHKLIMGKAPKGFTIDHINRKPYDNRRNNLRFATSREQNINKSKRKDNKSGTTGVIFVPSKNRWEAKVKVNGKRYQKTFSVAKYGYDRAEELAIQAREELKARHNYI